jgi:urease accessory protein
MAGLSGHLELVCALDGLGHSHLREQSFRAPIHLSKPHLDEDTLVVNVVNPTAGLLAGDRIALRVAVESGARLLLTAPSASRAHRMIDGRAELDQEFAVARGGWLESWPELFIPQGGARYRQRTTIRVEEGGELLFIESLAPGRVAAGEVFEYAALDWETDILLGGVLIARERYHLSRESTGVQALRAQFASGYYASCFVVTPRLEKDACWQRIHDLHTAEAWIGVSELGRGGWVVKVLAADSIHLRRVLAAVRAEIYGALGHRPPALRRT